MKYARMKHTLFCTLLALAIPAVAAIAQTSQKDTLLKHWKTSGEFTVAVANAMPADGYTFRPTPGEMSFGEVMAHIAVANRGACAAASGLTAPALPPKIAEWAKDGEKIEVDKDTATHYLEESFAFCSTAITGMPESRMNTVVGTPSRHLTGSEYLWAYFTHTAHHRGQAEVYLRLKGVKPPDYDF